MNRSYDMAFKVTEDINFPDEMWQEVISHSKHSLVLLSCVSKQFETLNKTFAENYRLKYCFGKVQWLSFGGDPGDEPFLPLKMIQNFDPDHQILTFIPETINNEGLTLSSIDRFVSKIAKKNTSYHSRSLILVPDSFVSKTKNHWVLLSKNILHGAQGNHFDVNKQFIQNNGFEIPKLIHTVVSVLMHNIKTGEFVYPAGIDGKPSIFTCVQEKRGSYQVVVGGFSTFGLRLCLLFKRPHDPYYDPSSFSIACATTSK